MENYAHYAYINMIFFIVVIYLQTLFPNFYGDMQEHKIVDTNFLKDGIFYEREK